MSSLVKRQLKHILILFLSVLRKKDTCLILSPHIPMQNLGDQALLLGALEGCKNFDSTILIRTGSDSCLDVLNSLGISNDKVKVVDDLQLAFATSKSFSESIKLYWLASQCTHCFVVGADVLDGTYNEKEVRILFDHIESITSLGVKVTVLGSSYSRRISESTIKGLSAVNRKATIYARDEFSLDRISPYCEARLSSDVAFLMLPSSHSVAYPEAKKTTIENIDCTLTIGVCIKKDEFNSADDSRIFIESIASLARKFQLRLVALPHHIDDLEALTKIFSLVLDPAIVIELPVRLPFAPEIKSKASECDLVITGRMHVAIASLDQGVPVICYSYGDKFKGLLKHFDLPYEVLVVEDKNPNLKPVLSYYLENDRILTSAVQKNIAAVRVRSRKNFE